MPILTRFGGGGSGGGLNFTVKAYNSLPASGKENEIAAITSTPMTDYFISAVDLYEEQRDRLAGVATAAGYLGSSGSTSAQDATRKEVYTVDAIPVEYGKEYIINYTLSESKAMRMLINEYNGTTHIQRIEPVASVTGTKQTVKYTPSASNVNAIRIAWATFGVTCTVTMPYTVSTAPDGMVWIRLGTDSPAPIWVDKENTVRVYPVSVFQHVNGVRTPTEAYVYQDNQWKKLLLLTLYHSGNEYLDTTGGWVAYAHKRHSNSGISDTALPTITRNATSIKFSNVSWKAGSVALQNKIDLTSVKTLVAKGTFYSSETDGKAELFVKTDIGSYAESNKVANYAVPTGSTVSIMTLDVSELSGEYYILFHVAHLSTIELTEFYGE